MANKRIELEQYKHYFDILAEEPNRKTWRRGIEIAFIAAALLVLALFVLGMMSGSLATNANNVLEKPPAKTTTTPESSTPTGTEVPYTPTQQRELPTNPIQNQQSPGSMAPSSPEAMRASYGIPFGAEDGALMAQVQTPPVDLQQSVPGETQSSTPAEQPVEKSSSKSTGPGKQTKGAGNLANLANGAGGRGFQLYLLVLLIALLVILYLPVRKARMEGKSK
jgi:hypothetical protein